MPAHPDINDLPPRARWEVDRVCTRFEAACQSGAVPRLEEYLGEPSAAERGVLLQELLLLELEYRRHSGEPVSLDELLARFPAAAEILRHVWRVAGDGTESTQPSLVGETPGPEGAVRLDGPLPIVPGYEVLEPIGRGGMAVVYAARSLKLNRLTALKLISVAQPSADLRRRFQLEAETVARLRHPNIVQIYDVGECPQGAFLALEHVAGGSLREFTDGAPQPPAIAAQLLETLARAVQFAHDSGVVHRDLKPANILLQKSEVRGQIGMKARCSVE